MQRPAASRQPPVMALRALFGWRLVAGSWPLAAER
jgi:hypothetical protein